MVVDCSPSVDFSTAVVETFPAEVCKKVVVVPLTEIKSKRSELGIEDDCCPVCGADVSDSLVEVAVSVVFTVSNLLATL